MKRKKKKCFHGIVIPKKWAKNRKDLVYCPKCKQWYINPEIIKKQMGALDNFFSKM